MDSITDAMTGAGVADEPDGSVTVFLDESYDPFVAACAVVIESGDVRRMDSAIESVYDRVHSRYFMGGMPTFEEFQRRGFHATNDPFEVRTAFVAFLSEVLNFKSLIVYSDRSARRTLSDKQRLMVVFDQLIRDVLGAYRSRPNVTFYFESAQGMDKYLERLVTRAVHSFGRRVPEVAVRFGTKREPHLLAVPDYVLHIVNRWLDTQDGLGPFEIRPADHESRSMKAILGSVSVARSLDDSRVIRRDL